jgi:hypothetical protein
VFFNNNDLLAAEGLIRWQAGDLAGSIGPNGLITYTSRDKNMNPVDSNRLKTWQALSSFFLDTEIDDLTYNYIARVVLETNYSPKEIHSILWNEVFPVLEANLRSVAGEWAGWTDEWLLEHISASDELEPRKGRGSIAKEIARCWSQVATRLPPGYA